MNDRPPSERIVALAPHVERLVGTGKSVQQMALELKTSESMIFSVLHALEEDKRKLAAWSGGNPNTGETS